ncbi:MAG: glycosyltransferase [Methylacidiphilales bacterium]|nr:glycosyltransferase [Candidatus Methylacidiphilales bacterium]
MSSFSPEHPSTEAARPLRILLVVEPGFDGVFRQVAGLVRFLLEQKQQVFFAYSDKRGSPELLELVTEAKKKGAQCLNLRVANAPHPRDLRALYQLWMFGRRAQPEIIHSHSSKAGVLGRTLALLGQKGRQFYTPHAYYGMAPRRGWSNDVYNGVERSYGWIGQTVNISEDEREFARDVLSISDGRALLIPIGIDTNHFRPPTPEEKIRLRRHLNLPENAVILGSMGRLSFQKDPQTLYRAFALARQQGRQFHLLHVGQGSEAETLESLTDQLNLQGQLLRIPYLREPLQFHRAIDGLILTSRYEGCPTVALEAMACDLPLILSTGPGNRWLGGCGLSHCWTAAVENVNGFAQAMTDWFDDLHLKRPSNHRDYAVSHFDLKDRYGDILKAYRSAAATNQENRSA